MAGDLQLLASGAQHLMCIGIHGVICAMQYSCINSASLVGAGGDGWIFPGTSMVNASHPIHFLIYLGPHVDGVFEPSKTCASTSLASTASSLSRATRSNGLGLQTTSGRVVLYGAGNTNESILGT